MYRCFKLSLDLHILKNNEHEFVEKYRKRGDKLKIELINSFESILNAAIDENEVISGEDFINSWFPITNYDVFLSYSHDDEESALFLAGFIESQFGLKVFIDSLFWGSADELLWEIDKEYCLNDTGDFDYKKRNFTTTHVHAMLTTAIAKAIYNSEIVIFLNSEKSIYKIEEEVEKNRTLSPWIYEEIFLTSVIGTREWYEHRGEIITEKMAYFEKAFQVSYVLPDEHLIALKYTDLLEWKKQWDNRRKCSNGRYGDLFLKENERIRHPLNVLYDCTCGYKE